MYHGGNRELQDRFDTRRLADRLDEVKVNDTVGEQDREFIEAREMFFLATADAEGHPTCSFKGGDPGFVRVIDERTVAWPNYDGNGMYLSLGNLLVNPWVGLLFIDWQLPRRLRLEGRAELDDSLSELWPGAQTAVRVAVERVYPNCPRYIPRMELAERSRFIPQEDEEAPVPRWKRARWARDVLPSSDPANDPANDERTL